MLRPAFWRCFAPGAFTPACAQALVYLLVDCSCLRLSSSQSCAFKRFIRRTVHSYRIRLPRLMEVIALEQRQLAEIFLIVLTIFFVLWWLLAYQFRVPG